MTGLYVHLPFCHAKCHYCDFAAFAGMDSKIDPYLSALSVEMSFHKGARLETVFFGGGTPTALSLDQWRFLWDALRSRFVISEDAEITVECNPESTEPEKLALLRERGVNRLSFGLQAVQPRLLKSLGRLHDYARFERAYQDARAAGFDNVNIDLMYGLPGQSAAEWTETLDRVIALAPEHLSAYALGVEDDTVFGRRGLVTDDDLQAEMYETAADCLEAAGYVHYEISNFSRPGRECRHNLRYWKNLPCLGIGVSAAGFDGHRRAKNVEEVPAYLSRLKEGLSPVEEEEILLPNARVGEDLMLALRLKEGAFKTTVFENAFSPVLERFRSLGFLTDSPDGRRWLPTRKGWLLSNQLFQELLSHPS